MHAICNTWWSRQVAEEVMAVFSNPGKFTLLIVNEMEKEAKITRRIRVTGFASRHALNFWWINVNVGRYSYSCTINPLYRCRN